jgi:hypothetical protein
MYFNLAKTVISAFIFGFFVFMIITHISKLWFSGALHESARNGLEGFSSTSTSAPSSAPTSAPTATEEPTENSEIIADLFDQVNKQIDIVRTLKEPYTEQIKTVSYDRDLSGNMIILSNLKTLVNVGIATNDKDLKTNAGIAKVYQYGGNDTIDELIADLASLDDLKLTGMLNLTKTPMCDSIASATDKETCVSKAKKQRLKEIEKDYLKRVNTVVDSHQRILDRILEKQSTR